MRDCNIRLENNQLTGSVNVDLTVLTTLGLDYPENGDAEVTTIAVASLAQDSIVWSLTGADSELFTISSEGELSFKSPPNYESAADFNTDNAYEVTIEASDGDLTGTLDVTIRVTDLDEVGSVTLSENQPQAGTEVTATLTDPDGNISATTWVWASSTDGSTNWSSISGATSASYTPVAADVGKYLRATASYTDGHGAGKSAQAVSANTVMAATPANQAPAFATDAATLEVAEDTASGGNVGSAVTATDGNADSLIYRLSGTDAASFAIGASTGQISVGSATSLDYESSTKSYNVTVSVHDGKNAEGTADTTVDDTITVTINVTNVDEQPSLSGSSAVSYPENGTASVASYAAVDPESATVNWTLSGDDSGDFSISIGGALSFNSSPDFETPTDANNASLVTVEAPDGTTDKVTLAVTVTVTNVEEAGAVILSPAQP